MRHKYLVLVLMVCALTLFSCSKKSKDKYPAVAGIPNPTNTGTGGPVDEPQFVQDVFAMVNYERSLVGSQALQWDAQVADVADGHSECMRDHGTIYHNCPYGHGTPANRLSSGGVSYMGCGENVAIGYPTPAAVMDGWRGSPGHWTNLLNSAWTHTGIGLAMPGFLWTQNFIYR